MYTVNEMKQWAKKANALFPEGDKLRSGVLRSEKINNDLEKAITLYNNASHQSEKDAIAKTFAGKMNSLSRVAYRKGYQAEITTITH